MTKTTTRRSIAAIAAAVLLMTASGCGSSDSSADKSSGDTPTTSASGGGSSDPGGTDAGSTEPGSPDSGGGGESKCVTDSDRISGSSTVIWTADSESEHTGDEATADTTLLIQDDGSMEPSKLTVGVGEVFTFGLADGVEDIAAIKVGCDGGQTVYSGPALAAEYITTPGTYTVVNDITGEEVGTITVE